MSDSRNAPAPPGLPPPDGALPDAVTGDPNDVLIAGHTYDGIREYDNPMPGWWTTLFWVCVLFAPVYMLGIHVFGYVDTYQEDLAEGKAELAAREAAWIASGPAFETDARALQRYADDPLMAASGAEIFSSTCASCHGAGGPGRHRAQPHGRVLAPRRGARGRLPRHQPGRRRERNALVGRRAL